MENALSYNPADQLTQLAGSLPDFLAEILLSVLFLIMIVVEITYGKRNPWIVTALGIAGIAASLIPDLILLSNAPAASKTLFLGMAQQDGLASWFKVIFALGGILTLLVSYRSSLKQLKSGEFPILIIGLVLGMNLMAMSSNLLMMYLSLELVSIASYVLTAFTLDNRKSAEASLKYFIYGAFSSGIMIYGISWIYGLAGTLNLADPSFSAAIANLDGLSLFFVLALIFAGFAFKISAIPFHFWAPDVYEGAPYPVAALFSVGPKVAGFAMLIRFTELVVGTDGASSVYFYPLLMIVAMGSMTFGNLAALRTDNLRRLIAYSGIAHAGTALLGIACLNAYGYTATIFYLSIYFFMNLGLFFFAGFLEEQSGIKKISEMNGLAKALPWQTVLLVILMAGLIGLPPTAGFIGKWNVFLAVFNNLEQDPIYTIALIVAILNTVISIFYYLKVPAGMVFKELSIKKSISFHTFQSILLIIVTFPVLLLGIWGFDRLITFIHTHSLVF